MTTDELIAALKRGNDGDNKKIEKLLAAARKIYETMGVAENSMCSLAASKTVPHRDQISCIISEVIYVRAALGCFINTIHGLLSSSDRAARLETAENIKHLKFVCDKNCIQSHVLKNAGESSIWVCHNLSEWSKSPWYLTPTSKRRSWYARIFSSLGPLTTE